MLDYRQFNGSYKPCATSIQRITVTFHIAPTGDKGFTHRHRVYIAIFHVFTQKVCDTKKDRSLLKVWRETSPTEIGRVIYLLNIVKLVLYL